MQVEAPLLSCALVKRGPAGGRSFPWTSATTALSSHALATICPLGDFRFALGRGLPKKRFALKVRALRLQLFVL